MNGTEGFGLSAWIEAQTKLASAWAEAVRHTSAGGRRPAFDSEESRTADAVGPSLREGWAAAGRWYEEALRAAMAAAGPFWGVSREAGGQAEALWTKELEGLRAAYAEAAAFQGQPSEAMGADAHEPLHEKVLRSFETQMTKLLNAPAFGWTREFQAKTSDALSAWIDLCKMNAAYASELRNATANVMQLFQQKLAERKEKGQVIQSPAELLELWSEAAEEGYFPVAANENFAHAQAQVTNAAMRYLQSSQAIGEDFNRSLGIPTRSDIDDAFLRLQEMKRQLRSLRREVGSLRAELDELRAGGNPAPVSKQPGTPEEGERR